MGYNGIWHVIDMIQRSNVIEDNQDNHNGNIRGYHGLLEPIQWE